MNSKGCLKVCLYSAWGYLFDTVECEYVCAYCCKYLLILLILCVPQLFIWGTWSYSFIAMDLQPVKPQEYIYGSPCDSDGPYLFFNFGTLPRTKKVLHSPESRHCSKDEKRYKLY